MSSAPPNTAPVPGSCHSSCSLIRLRVALTSQEIARYAEYCLKPGKAPGLDKCPNELLKTMSNKEFLIVQAWVNEILTLSEKTINTARQSQSNMNGTILQLHKGGSTNKTSDQRLVVLLNSGYQLLNYIINERLKWIVEKANGLEPEQGGWRHAGSKCQHQHAKNAFRHT